MELILVGRAENIKSLETLDTKNFAHFKALAHDLSSSARARAEGVRAAQGATVIFSEDHAFPLSDHWAERLLRHRAYASGVGPIMRNANPRTAASWASLMIEYGMWLRAPKPGFVSYIAGHNSAYDREMLLSYGDDLSDMLEAEWVLQNDLRKKGHKFWIAPEIEVAHLNYSLVKPSLALHLGEGRMFAASRSASWSLLKRAAFALAWPLIFIKRLVAVSWDAWQAGLGREWFRALPLLVLFLAVSTLGEGLGYAFGEGRCRNWLAGMEYQRWRNIHSDEVTMQTGTSR